MQEAFPAAALNKKSPNIFPDSDHTGPQKVLSGSMFDFFKKGNGDPETVQAPHSTVLDSTRGEGASRSDLVQLVLGDLLQLHNIPAAWLGYEIHARTNTRNATEVHIHLLIHRWSEQLLRYSAALENQFRLGLDRFEPGVDHSRYLIAWRFARDCELPFPSIPDAVPWHVSVKSNPSGSTE